MVFFGMGTNGICNASICVCLCIGSASICVCLRICSASICVCLCIGSASICVCLRIGSASICETCYRVRVGILSPEDLYPMPAAVREGPLIDSVRSRKRRLILPYSAIPPTDLILATTSRGMSASVWPNWA